MLCGLHALASVAYPSTPCHPTGPQLVSKRPVSPHVFEITGVQPHYKFPLGAISSITNRATGCMLSVGAWAGLFEHALCWCCQLRTSHQFVSTCSRHAGMRGYAADLAGLVGVCAPAGMLESGSRPPLCPRLLITCSSPAGTWAAAYIALTGDLGAAISAFKEAAPLLVFPAKAVVAFPLVRPACMCLRQPS